MIKLDTTKTYYVDHVSFRAGGGKNYISFNIQTEDDNYFFEYWVNQENKKADWAKFYLDLLTLQLKKLKIAEFSEGATQEKPYLHLQTHCNLFAKLT